MLKDPLAIKRLQEQVEERRRVDEELRTRKWKASEIRDLMEEARAAGADSVYLATAGELDQIEQMAKREGRWVDDLSPTFANLRAYLGAGAWIVPRGNVGLLMEWARAMDSAARGTASQSVPAPRTFAEATLAWAGWCGPRGAVSNEQTLGVLYAAALPSWFHSTAMTALHLEGGWVTRVVARGSDEEAANPDLVRAQADRWEALEDTWRLLAELVRAGAKTLDDLPPMLDGMRWEPFPTGAAPDPGLLAFTTRTREVRRFLANRAKAELDAAKARAIAEVEGADGFRARLAQGADPKTDPTIVANGWKG